MTITVKELRDLLQNVRDDYILTDLYGRIIDDLEIDDDNQEVVLYTEGD